MIYVPGVSHAAWVHVVVDKVEIPQLPFVEKIVMTQTVQCPQTSESLNTAKHCEVTVAWKISHETVVRDVVQNIELDSYRL